MRYLELGLLFTLGWWSFPASAADGLEPAVQTEGAAGHTDGTYVLEGSSYSIDVTFGDGTLTVIEPNKTTVYHRQGQSNSFFSSDPPGVYGLRVIDGTTLEAFKPNTSNPPTTLKLHPPVALGGGPAQAVSERAQEIAAKYGDLSRSDPVNAQTWTQCSAAATLSAMMPADQAKVGVVEAATLLKMTIVDKSKSPCPDAIPPAAWAAAPSY